MRKHKCSQPLVVLFLLTRAPPPAISPNQRPVSDARRWSERKSSSFKEALKGVSWPRGDR